MPRPTRKYFLRRTVKLQNGNRAKVTRLISPWPSYLSFSQNLILIKNKNKKQMYNNIEEKKVAKYRLELVRSLLLTAKSQYIVNFHALQWL